MTTVGAYGKSGKSRTRGMRSAYQRGNGTIGKTMTQNKTEAAIRAAYRHNQDLVLAIDPDAHTPGAALWERSDDGGARAYAWGGNASGANLVNPRHVRDWVRVLSPGIVVIEAPLSSGGAFARSMHAQNIVRGGWLWTCEILGIPAVLLPPGIWQRATCGVQRGAGSYKRAYKAHACDLLRKPRVNEDCAAALCMLEYTLGVLGLTLPSEIIHDAP